MNAKCSLSGCGGESCIQICVHLVNLGLVDLSADITLELESRGKNLVGRRELIGSDVERLWLLQAVQLTQCSELVDLFLKQLDEVSVLRLEDSVHILAILLAPLAKHFLAGHNNADAN